MDGSALPPPRQTAPWRWIIGAFVLGGAGALGALASFGSAAYPVGPLVVELNVKPSAGGTTEISVEPIAGTPIKAGYFEADTHAGFLTLGAKVVDVRGRAFIDLAAQRVRTPKLVLDSIKEDGKNAMKRFAIRTGLVALAGGAAGGAFIGLLTQRFRRVIQGAVGGLILVGLLGVITWQTYDESKFTRATFKSSAINL